MSGLPAFNEFGDLPPGLHRISLAGAIAHFGKGTGQRSRVGERLARIHALANSTAKLRRFIIFGSFVTDKAEPGDVDVFLVMENDFDVSTVTGEARHVFDHMAAHNLLGASVFWVPRAACLGGEDEAILFWQTKRDGKPRGIVEITAHDRE